MYKIYKFTLPNGKVYIGRTAQTNINRRWDKGRGYSSNIRLTDDIEKYGWDNITKEIIEEDKDKEEASLRERYYILKYNSHLEEFGYNKHTNVDCAPKLRKYYKCVETGEVFESMVMIAEKIGVTKSAVSAALKQNRKCKGKFYEKVYMTREEFKAARI